MSKSDVVKIRSAYVESVPVRKVFSCISLTKQGFKDECDINNILRKFKKTLGVDFLSQYSGYLGGRFGDVSVVPDYQAALHQISDARACFEAMPSKLRSRFDNDPVKLLSFLSDVGNRDEALALGLLKPVVNSADVKSDVVSPGKP